MVRSRAAGPSSILTRLKRLSYSRSRCSEICSGIDADGRALENASRLGRSDGNRETLLFDFPAIKLSSGSPAVSGKNQDVMIDAGFQAVMHAPFGYTVSVSRFWYLPSS
jgi:hypothetical protein